MVRLHNGSGETLDDVSASFRGRIVRYGRIPAGETTPYQSASGAYRYAYIEATVDGQRVVLQPIDFVGETPLGPGRFTYHLTLDRENRALVITDTRRDD